MIVQCPGCSTRYRVDARRLTRENPTFRCSRCGSTFARFPDRRAEPPTSSHARAKAGPAGQGEAPQTATLPLLLDGQPPGSSAKLSINQQPVAGKEETRGDSQPHPLQSAGVDNQPSLALPGAQLPAAPNAPGGHSLVARGWVQVQTGAIMPCHNSSFRPICWIMTAILAAHVIVALSLRTSYQRTEAFFSLLPIIGQALLEEHALASKVDLRMVSGSYQIIKDRKKVFAISGEAVNNSATTVSDVQVEGTITASGGRIWRKFVFCGNQARLTDLSELEIDLLHNLDPSFSLLPGESSRFVIVFTDPPSELKEFSSRVFSVRPVPKESSA